MLLREGISLLNEYVSQALVGSFDLKIAEEKIHEVRAMYHMERTNLAPHIDGKGEYSRTRISQNLFTSPFRGPSSQDFYTLGFDALWEIDFFDSKIL